MSITRNGRDRLVVMAVEEYRRLRRRHRVARKVSEMSAAELEWTPGTITLTPN